MRPKGPPTREFSRPTFAENCRTYDTLRQSVRPADLVGRVGGEEFAVFLPRVGSRQALDLAERLRVAVSRIRLKVGTREVLAPISVSIGAAVFHGPIGYEDLFQAADALLYEAKGHGRDQVVMSNVLRVA